eukprot:CAMPEP_0178904398 /NCGR_PEP_ID=MMETSP0786-20121207/5678_1 /TAXON_ID=186022 /ORGANISM="Thalassionema frauenfeldii, Strain CCMP 1798" /LENGTH=45 /DNA_ID= /DNA_START= /DNA_END= /DNA_ORIENTATION=
MSPPATETAPTTYGDSTPNPKSANRNPQQPTTKLTTPMISIVNKN